MLDHLRHDIVGARRSLARRPFFALTAAGLVALGAGSLGALLCVVKPVLIEGLPFRDVDRLVMVWQQDLPANRDRITVAGGEFTEYQAGSKLLESLAAARPAPALTTMPALVVLFALGVDMHGVDGTPRAPGATTSVWPILRFASRQLGRDLFISAALPLFTYVPAGH